MSDERSSGQGSFWKSKTGLTTCAFLGIAGILLIVEHRAHVLDWLPYAILLACPLLHVFMHGGHGHGGHGHDHSAHASREDRPRERGDA